MMKQKKKDGLPQSSLPLEDGSPIPKIHDHSLAYIMGLTFVLANPEDKFTSHTNPTKLRGCDNATRSCPNYKQVRGIKPE